jgi:hypothetical protein
MITLQLTIDQVNGILQALAKEPYASVAALIESIREQGIPQAQALQEKEQAEKNAAGVSDVEATS